MDIVLNSATGKWEYVIFGKTREFESKALAEADFHRQMDWWLDDPYDYL
jgi:hypothetical protein